jgi:hypothetical protein
MPAGASRERPPVRCELLRRHVPEPRRMRPKTIQDREPWLMAVPIWAGSAVRAGSAVPLGRPESALRLAGRSPPYAQQAPRPPCARPQKCGVAPRQGVAVCRRRWPLVYQERRPRRRSSPIRHAALNAREARLVSGRPWRRSAHDPPSHAHTPGPLPGARPALSREHAPRRVSGGARRELVDQGRQTDQQVWREVALGLG